MTILDEFRQDEQRVLDRLVDGELGVHERRELLGSLDDEPGAWRLCAMSFLEAQSWRWQLSRMATEPILAQLSAPPQNGAARRAFFWGGAFAIAASLAVAFALGTRFPGNGRGIETAVNPIAPDGQQTSSVGRPEPSPAPVELAAEIGADERLPWQTLTLTPVGADASDGPIELRVSTADEAAPLFAEQASLSSLLMRRFEQEGWEVNRRQRLLPIDLSDGRRLVVPIEEVDLHRPDEVQF